MKNLRISIVLALVAILVVGVACAASPTPPPSTPTPPAGKALMESRCSVCHPLTTISTAKYNKAGWEATVTRMVNKGAQLNPQQAGQVVDYLALTYQYS